MLIPNIKLYRNLTVVPETNVRTEIQRFSIYAFVLQSVHKCLP
jgi:hypothetical protein